MNISLPHLVVIAGPNGAGKSTTAPSLLKGTLGVTEFVNADLIAQGLSAFKPEMTAFQSGRVMLERLHYLAKKRFDFAFETTLASKTFTAWIEELKTAGYSFQLIFLYLPNEDFAVARVAERVRSGGHNVPEETIRRRYRAGLKNFFKLYCHIADTWYFYDNSGEGEPELIASGKRKQTLVVKNPAVWHNIEKEYGDQRKT